MNFQGKYEIHYASKDCMFPPEYGFYSINDAIQWFDSQYDRKGFVISIVAGNLNKKYTKGEIVLQLKKTYR